MLFFALTSSLLNFRPGGTYAIAETESRELHGPEELVALLLRMVSATVTFESS